jgi:hypothetical protein
MCRKCRRRDYMRDWKAAHPESVRRTNRSYYERNAEGWNEGRDRSKHQARLAVYSEIRAGRLEKGECEVGIGCTGRIEAHHDDYERPLEIRWLCKRHHMLLHSTRSEVAT